MKKLIVSTVLFFLMMGFISCKEENKTYQLYDGETFKGWTGDTIHTWRIENAALVGGSLTDTVPHNEFLATTDSFTNFDLHLQFKLVGTGFVNAGVQFRSEHVNSPSYEMTGYQADLGNGYWGSLYDESRRNKTLAQPDSSLVQQKLRLSDWNDYRIRCEGRHIQIWLNDAKTVDYTEPDTTIPLTGLIAFQIHGGGKAEASYRNITITELPAK